MGKKAQTIGYHYLFSLYWGLCRGPINELVEIKAGDLTAWRGNSCADEVEYIHKPDLFGGEKKEGGIQGPFAVFQGAPDQVLPGAQTVDAGKVGTDMPDNVGGLLKVVFTGGLIAGRTLPSIKALIGEKMSEMRGVVTLWFDGLVTSMNPYPKEWKFRVRRSSKGWMNDDPWYPEKAAIYLRPDFLSLVTDGQWIGNSIDGSTGRVWFDGGVASVGDTITINGHTLTMVAGDVFDDGLNVGIGNGEFRPAYNLFRVINRNVELLKAKAEMPSSNVVRIELVSTDGIHAMNGAHIIYEACTNASWGRGLPREEMGDSFVYAANRLCDEGFGLCIAWYRKEDIDEFIKTVLNYIGGAVYVDRESGKTELKLIRDDYTLDEIPLFTPDSGLLDIVEDDSQASDTAYNEVIVTGHSPITDQDIQVRSHNLAARISQGSTATLDLAYPGLPTLALCSRVAQRDLRVHAAGLKKYDVRLDRRAWRITPGSVIRVADPRRNLGMVVLRVGEIDDGNMASGEIKAKCVQDVFGLPATSFVQPVASQWSAPSAYPKAATAEAFELSYRDLYLNSQQDDSALDDGDSFVGVYAASPQPNSFQYDLVTKPGGNVSYETDGTHGYTANFVVTNALAPLDTLLHIGASQELPEPDEQISLVGQALVIGDETMRIDAFDHEAMTMTVARGAGDTIPQAHPAGARAWLADDDVGSDEKLYQDGETVNAKVLPRTGQGVLLESAAAPLTVKMVGRAARPYPPADVRLYRTHRYWRVLITGNRDPGVAESAVKELRFYGPGGVLLAGPLSASSENPSYPVIYINDHTAPYDNPWASTGPLPHWLKIDLGANESAVERFELLGRGGFYGESQTPTSYTLQWSDTGGEDDAEWTDWQAYPNVNAGNNGDKLMVNDARGPSSIFNISGIYPSPILAWVGRNRITQADHLVGHTEPNVLEEEGTTYRVTVFSGSTQIGLYEGITDHFFEYDNLKQAADGATGTVRLRLETVRDGLASRAYEEEIVVPIVIGYGLGYGLNYGGVE